MMMRHDGQTVANLTSEVPEQQRRGEARGRVRSSARNAAACGAFAV